MHCLCASGGVAQYEANALCLSLQKHDIKLSDLDDFASHVTWPNKLKKCKPPNNFFQERVHDGKDKTKDPHLKASGGETLTAVVILGLFISIVVKPSGILRAACASLLLLRDIIDLLCDLERAVEQVQHLRSLMRRHHVAFLEAYPDKLHLVKPKFHLMYHIADCIERHRVLLSCWSGERLHHIFKGVAANFCRCIRDAEQCFALKRLVAGCLQHYQQPNAARKMFFPVGTRVRSEPAWMLIPPLMHEELAIGNSMEVGKIIHCHLGVVHSGDLVILAGPLLGRVNQFAAAKSTTSGSTLFFVLIHVCVQNTASGRWATGPSSSWHFATALEALVPAFALGAGCFHPAIPSFFKI